MKTSIPRYLQLTAILCVTLVVLPPAFAMDIMERMITTQTSMIRREASEYQRKVAEANARAYLATQLHAYRQSKSVTGPVTKGKKHTAPENQAPATAEEKKALKKKLPRYVAIETPKDKRSAPGTKKDVMIFDTQNESLVSNNVYDMQSSPALGAMLKVETYSAQYIGNGL
jgi:hypothetical protein